MRKQAVTMLAIVGLVGSLGAQRRDVLVSFEGGIGVIPASAPAQPVNGDGTFQNVTRNIVRGINPAGGPWRIASLDAEVETDGRVHVRGRGLLLAGGNSIGQNANQRVFATLICEAAAPFVERSSDLGGVALEANGDFRIDDVLNSGTPDCASPVLLIRSSGNGSWFAAGIVKTDDK